MQYAYTMPASPPHAEQLVAAHRTACLHADEYGQAVALNLLLRSYIAADEYALAQARQRRAGLGPRTAVPQPLYISPQALVVKATFPEAASAAQFARYLYYRGRIYAVQASGMSRGCT